MFVHDCRICLNVWGVKYVLCVFGEKEKHEGEEDKKLVLTELCP